MARFTVKKSASNQWYFRLEASGNYETILTSEMYNSRSTCDAGIASVRSNAPYDFRYERLYSINKQYYFNLKGGNGEIVGNSETYVTTSSRDAGISLVKQQAASATINDLT